MKRSILSKWLTFKAGGCFCNGFSKKGIGPLKTSTALGHVWGTLSMVSICKGLIASFVIPFVLLASPYTNCREGKLSAYYVLDPQLCKTITPEYWQSYDDK
ncbi:hypothetical protein [Rahnella sikkimica]|uniref:hypothetical protein n=1 Tax=Rahnella sikkimica TaxID=1805933 RepID=UPI0018659447|nr:hypothetical protein [Rahnella sikkimica]